jgi:hypothetical protein
MPEQVRILAGDCTVTDEDADGTRRERGNVLVVTKTDNCGELLVGRAGGDASSVSPCTTPTVSRTPNDYTDRVRTNG